MVTVDHSALATLCVAAEKVRIARPNDSKNLVKRIFSKITLRGTIAIAKVGAKPVVEQVKINACVTVSDEHCLKKIREGRATCVDSLMVAFVMFGEDSLNESIELIYAHYLLYKREKEKLEIHKKILGHEKCTTYTKLIAKKFFAELVL